MLDKVYDCRYSVFSVSTAKETLIKAPRGAGERENIVKPTVQAKCFHADLNKSAFP